MGPVIRECGCPPPTLPPTRRVPDRMVRCAHFEGKVVRLFRHADIPTIFCIETGATDLPRTFLDQDAAEASFARAVYRMVEAVSQGGGA